MKKSFIALLAVTFCACLFVSHAQAVVLFQEDWDSGAINPSDWTVEGVGGPFVYDLGVTGQSSSGDYGLFVADPFTYVTGIRSTASFSRADQLSCTFKLFRDNVSFGWAGVGGPWSGVGTLPAGALPTLRQIEAGVNRHNPNNNQTYYREGVQAAFAGDGAALSSAFNTAFDNATTKANAVIVRVTLGETTGSKMEWSTDGATWTTEINTIGQTAGQDLGGGNSVSASDPAWLVFASAGDGVSNARGIVDDIVVEGIPEPATLTLLGLGGLLAYRRRR